MKVKLLFILICLFFSNYGMDENNNTSGAIIKNEINNIDLQSQLSVARCEGYLTSHNISKVYKGISSEDQKTRLSTLKEMENDCIEAFIKSDRLKEVEAYWDWNPFAKRAKNRRNCISRAFDGHDYITYLRNAIPKNDQEALKSLNKIQDLNVLKKFEIKTKRNLRAGYGFLAAFSGIGAALLMMGNFKTKILCPDNYILLGLSAVCGSAAYYHWRWFKEQQGVLNDQRDIGKKLTTEYVSKPAIQSENNASSISSSSAIANNNNNGNGN